MVDDNFRTPHSHILYDAQFEQGKKGFGFYRFKNDYS